MQDKPTAPDFGNVFAATALLVLPLAVLAPLAIAWAALIPVVWIVVIQIRAGTRPWTGRSWRLPVAFAGLVVYGALSTLWSLTPGRSVDVAIKLVPIIAGGWLLVTSANQLDASQRKRTSTALLIGAAIAFALIAIEVATGGLIHGLYRGEGLSGTGSLIHLNRTASTIVVMVWLLALILLQRYGVIAAAGAIAIAAAALLSLNPDTPLVALVAGIGFLALAHLVPGAAKWLLIAGFLVVALAVPFYPLILPAVDNFLLGLQIDDLTLRHRFAIWEFAATRTMEQPILGWGLGSSRAIPGSDIIIERLNSRAAALPLHPHNALLQMWLELGVPGIALALFAAITILANIGRFFTGRKEYAVALTVLFSATLIAELSYGVWQSWWLVFLWVAAALTIAIAGNPPQPKHG